MAGAAGPRGSGQRHGATREELVTETGEWRDDRPSDSHRNILRSGFEERYVTANRLRPATQPAPSR